MQVRYLTAENFAAIFRSVLRDNTIQEFKEDLRRTDVLLIDDVQFLQNKTKTEEEFFHTFNFKISCKASDVFMAVAAYQQLAEVCDYPLHVGITEADGLRLRSPRLTFVTE